MSFDKVKSFGEGEEVLNELRELELEADAREGSLVSEIGIRGGILMIFVHLVEPLPRRLIRISVVMHDDIILASFDEDFLLHSGRVYESLLAENNDRFFRVSQGHIDWKLKNPRERQCNSYQALQASGIR